MTLRKLSLPTKRSLLILGLLSLLSASCASNEELQDRMDKRNDWYQDLQDRREIRHDAREERSDAWYDRVMN